MAPGWFPDPWRVAAWRWWDGAAWSPVTSGGSMAAQTATPGDAQVQRKPRLPMWLSVPVVVAAVPAVPLLVLALVFSPVSSLLALVPLAIVLPTLAWLDRVEPEPRQSRLHALLWGASVAVLVAAIVNSIVAVVISETVATVVSAPVVEELMKGLGILWILRRKEIDGVADGLVYAGWVALGFAVVEDVQYFLVASSDGVLAQTFVVRALLTPFAHPLFTAWTGLAIGLAVARGVPVMRWAPIGYAVAVALHASWNGSLTLATGPGGGWLILLAIVVFVGIFATTVTMLVRFRTRERARFTAAVPVLAARYGISAQDGLVFTDWAGMLRARKALDRAGRRRFDRRHAALARLAALNARPGGPPADDEARLLAGWHDAVG